MRRYFGTWGLELTDDDFAQAVAAWGVLEAGGAPLGSLKPEAIQKELNQRLGLPFQDGDRPHDPVPWGLLVPLHDPRLPQRPLPSPRALAAAWQKMLEEVRAQHLSITGPRLIIPRGWWWWRGWPEVHSRNITDWLARPSVSCASVFVPIRTSHASREPDRWPLRLGLLVGPGSDLLREELAREASKLFFHYTPEVLTPARARCGLLVLPQGLREAVSAVLSAPVRPDTDTVLVLGPVEEADSAMYALLNTLRELCNGRTVILARASTRAATPQEAARYVNELVARLSHNQPLDVAAFSASRQLSLPPPYVHAHPPFLEASLLATRLERLGERLERSTFANEPLPRSIKGLESFSSPQTTFRELSEQLKNASSPKLDWTHESGPALGLADLGTRTRELSANAALEAPSRFLRTRVMAPQGEGEDHPAEALQPAQSYRAEVSIGPQAPEHLALDEQFPDLSDQPPDGDGHLLQVVFFAPRLMSEPQSGEIRLPPMGSSSTCGFYFHTREGVDSLEARITVLHRNRVLQTGVLRGRIDGRSALTFELDAVARTHLQVLSERSHFDGALVVNDTDDGESVVTAMAETIAARIKLGDGTVNQLTTVLNSQLSDIAEKPEDYRTLRDEGNVRLLRDLARRGSLFHEQLAKHSIIGPRFHGQGPVQVVSARPDAFLPIELAYRFPLPGKHAPLCAHAEGGLEAGSCPEPCKEGGTADRVCPLGFWSTSRVIERHEHRPQHTGLTSDHELRCEPLGSRTALVRPSAAVMAASPIASKAEPDTVTKLHAALAEVFPGKAYQAHSWAEWVEHVARPDRPMLLVLLPHHSQGNHAVELLELMDKDTLESFDVGEEHVVGKPRVTPPHPVVFLLGCETQLARVAFESFVARFRNHGAAIVVSTIATVLGRDAGPVAAELARELLTGGKGEGAFGERLLRARRRLLLQGRVMVLSLTAYGDADWKLTE